MKERVSKRAIELRLEWLNKSLGRSTKPWTPHFDENGNRIAVRPTDSFYIDHQLGGYRLETGGSPVFGSQRMTKLELLNQLEAILVAIKLARGEHDGSNWPDKAPDGTQIKPS